MFLFSQICRRNKYQDVQLNAYINGGADDIALKEIRERKTTIYQQANEASDRYQLPQQTQKT